MTMKIIRLLNLIGSLFIACSIFMIGLNSVQYTDSLKTKSMKDLVEYSRSDFYNKLNDNTIDELQVKLLYNIGMAQYQYRYTKRSGKYEPGTSNGGGDIRRRRYRTSPTG